MTDHVPAPTRLTSPKVGIVGAGDISPVHIEALQALPSVEIVGICDLDRARAEQRASAYGIPVRDSLEALVEAGANVIHVLTPPHAHAPVAIRAMELGCHVFIEKPMAEDVDDCRAIAEAAARTGKVATVDHLTLFDPQVQRALAQVKAGKIGKVVSIDIIRGGEILPYEGGPLPSFLADAGFPFRDLGVHCFTIFQAFLGPILDVTAEWQSLGGEPSIPFDEWRAVVKCRDGMGQFQITFNAKPIQNQVFIHGTKGIIRIDQFSLFNTTRKASALPRPVERLVNVGTESMSALLQAPASVAKFATKKLQRLQGIRDHIAIFYDHLATGEPMPITLDEATELVKWNEHVARAAEADYAERLKPFEHLSDEVDVLVTGASGSVGKNLVRRLLDSGTSVRGMVRRIPDHPIEGVEYVIGNLGDPAAVDRAVRGAHVVVHAGATMTGWPAEFKAGTVVATQNVVDSCLEHGVDQLVHISSTALIDYLGSHEGRPVNENAAYEPHPDQRGLYTQSKLTAEQIVRDAVATRGLPAVILRPGVIFGGGVDLVTGAVAQGGPDTYTVLGDGEVTVSLIYMDDVIDAIETSIDRRLVGGEIIQLIDPAPLTQNEILAAIAPHAKVRHVPREVLFRIGRATEPLFAKLGKQSPFGEYRLRSALSKMTFDGLNAAPLLDWKPAVGVAEGLRRYREALAAQQPH